MGKSLDELLRGIGNAVTDIRHKLVEEGYFGRVVTDGTTHVEVAPGESEPQEPASGPVVPGSGKASARHCRPIETPAPNRKGLTMAATPDQARLAQEVLDGTREVTGSAPVAPPEPEPLPVSLSGMPEEAKQQLYDVRAALSAQVTAVEATGSTSPAQPDLELKQSAFERSEVPHDIQRTNDMKAPGE